MSLASLPIELLDVVCEPLATCPSALAGLTRTCKFVRSSATRTLYRTISISKFARNLPLVHTLASRPDLAELVHDFSITLNESQPILRAFYLELQVALSHMPLLSSLVVLVDAGASWVLPVHAAPLSQLEHFACSFPFDVHVSAFLRQTPSLRSLQISGSGILDTQVLPDTHVPLLDSYTGPAVLLSLFASRPLSTIHLIGDLRIEDIPHPAGAPDAGVLKSEPVSFPYEVPKHPACEEFVNGRKKLRVFSAITSAPPAEVLELLARVYPDLAYVRLMTTSAFWESPNMALYSRISDTLSSLHGLSSFELSGMHWEARTKANSPSPSGVGTGCFEKEWVSPPVSPRAIEDPADLDAEGITASLEFGDSYFDWSY